MLSTAYYRSITFCILETCIYYIIIIVFSVSLLAGTIKAFFHHIAHQIHVATIKAVVNCLLPILLCMFAKLYH